MKIRLKIIFTGVLFLLIACQLFSQKAPIKYGKVDISDLEMKYYDQDSSAPAVILCDYGHFDPNKFEFRRIIRIKILRKEGYNWGNRIFNTASRTNIRGITFNLENGEIIKNKLKSESIFKERVTDDFYLTRVAMPNVKVGSVLDIEFTFLGFPFEWRFQQEIPEKYNELIIWPSPYINFRQNFFGYEPLKLATSTRWIAENMPAFKKEPYINSKNNYLTKFEFDILRISYPGYHLEISSSWKAISRILLKNEYFGLPLASSGYLKNIRDEINDKDSTDLEKIKSAFEIVKKVKWNDKVRIQTTQPDLRSAYKKEIGNSSDINLMLVQLLRKLKIDAYPIILSTRENGYLSKNFPSLFKSNYVIAYTKLGDEEYLLDATEELMPFGLLPKRCLNLHGRLIDYKKSKWIDLKTDKKDKKVVFYNLQMDEDFNLSGTISNARYDYNAFDFRKKYEKYNTQEEFLDEFLNNKTGLTVINTKIENIDSIYLPVKEKYEVEIDNQVSVLNDKVYLELMLFDKLNANPFKSDKRNYPVDFAYPIIRNYIVKIQIQENMTFSEIPKSLRMKLPENDASFTYNVVVSGNIIQLTSKLYINKTLFLMDEYPDLKEFYNQVIKKQSEPIIITTK
jgi:hypothetical protein